MFCDGDFDPWSTRKGNELTLTQRSPTYEYMPSRARTFTSSPSWWYTSLCVAPCLPRSPPGVDPLSDYSTDGPRHRILLPDAVHQIGNMWVTSFAVQTSSQGQRTDVYIRLVGDFPKGSRIGCLAIKGNSSLLSSVFITVLIGVSSRSLSCRRRDLEQH